MRAGAILECFVRPKRFNSIPLFYLFSTTSAVEPSCALEKTRISSGLRVALRSNAPLAELCTRKKLMTEICQELSNRGKKKTIYAFLVEFIPFTPSSSRKAFNGPDGFVFEHDYPELSLYRNSGNSNRYKKTVFYLPLYSDEQE